MQIVDRISLKDFEKYPNLKYRKIFQLLKKQNYQCKQCSTFGIEIIIWYSSKYKNFGSQVYGINSSGKEILFTIDHIIPKSRGGKRGNNLQVLCKECNSKKADKIIKENSNAIQNRQEK